MRKKASTATSVAKAREQIIADYAALKRSLETGLERARRIGVTLTRLRHNEFIDDAAWSDFLGTLPFGESSARNYMRVARKWGTLAHRNLDELTYTDAVRILSSRRRSNGDSEPGSCAWTRTQKMRFRQHSSSWFAKPLR